MKSKLPASRTKKVKGVLSTAIVGALVLLSAGCSSTEPSPEVAPISGETRIVVDAEGKEITVPASPERIVTLSEPTLDGVLALGITPIGTVSGRGQSGVPNYLNEQAADLPLLGAISQPNFEAIGAAKPDLILVDGTSVNNNPPVLEALSQIAPVVYTGYAGGDWRKNFTIVADAVGQSDKGAAVIAEYEERVAQARIELGDYQNKTFSIVRWQGTAPSLILKELPPGQALSDLGLARPSEQERFGRGHSEPVSLENLQSTAADYIFFGTLGGASVDNPNAGGNAGLEGAASALAAAQSVPGFNQLTAFQNGQIILVDGSVWTSTGGPILMNQIVSDVLEALR